MERISRRVLMGVMALMGAGLLGGCADTPAEFDKGDVRLTGHVTFGETRYDVLVAHFRDDKELAACKLGIRLRGMGVVPVNKLTEQQLLASGGVKEAVGGSDLDKVVVGPYRIYFFKNRMLALAAGMWSTDWTIMPMVQDMSDGKAYVLPLSRAEAEEIFGPEGPATTQSATTQASGK